MDTSKEYILMCEKAVEIQKLFYNAKTMKHASPTAAYLHHGFILTNEDKNFITSKECHCCNSTIGETWLPRQDQLQEMVKLKDEQDYTVSTWLNQITAFSNGGKFGELKDYIQINWSMEQLWLAFVMKEKYGKTWNGTDWVK